MDPPAESVAGRTGPPIAVVARLVAALALLVLISWALGAVTRTVLPNHSPSGPDQATLRFAVAHRRAWLTTSMRGLTQLGSGHTLVPLVIAVALAGWWRRRSWLAGGLLGGAYLGAWVAYSIVKELVHRARPPAAAHLVAVTGWSFPSGHAAQAAAVWGAAAYLWSTIDRAPRRRTAVWAGTAAITALVGASRAYLGVHWASDVVAGWILGAAWLAALITIIRTEGPRRTRLAEREHRGRGARFADRLPPTRGGDPTS